MRKIVLVILLLSFIPVFAVAQVPTSGNLFVGYSYYNTNVSSSRQSLNGWQGSLEGKFFPVPFLSIVADFSANYGNLSFPVLCPVGIGACGPVSANAHVDNFLIGPRASVSVGKFRPFAEAMFGFGHITTNGFGSDTSFATGIGGGLDYHLISLLSWRFEGDYIHTHLFNAGQNNVRISTGIVLRF